MRGRQLAAEHRELGSGGVLVDVEDAGLGMELRQVDLRSVHRGRLSHGEIRGGWRIDIVASPSDAGSAPPAVDRIGRQLGR